MVSRLNRTSGTPLPYPINRAMKTRRNRQTAMERETLAPRLAVADAPPLSQHFRRPIERLYTAEDLPESTTPGTSTIPHISLHTRHPRHRLPRQIVDVRQLRGSHARKHIAVTARSSRRRHGLSVAFDLPTLMGRDPDHELSLGEVGKCGVSVTSLADMELLFDGIALGDITSSMTINSPAAMIFAMYLVVAEQQGVAWDVLSGTIQNDILKEFIAQRNTSPAEAVDALITDIFAFCSREVRVGHHFGERVSHPRAGATRSRSSPHAADGLEYVHGA